MQVSVLTSLTPPHPPKKVYTYIYIQRLSIFLTAGATMALPSDGAAATVKQGSQAPLLCWLHASYGALWETLRENEEEKMEVKF